MKLYSLDNVFIKETNDVPIDFIGIVESSDGTKEWWVCGQWHRLDGPAVVWLDGTKIWYFKDNRHRLDGPACEYWDGYKEWYIDGIQVTEEQCKLLYDIMKLKGLL